MRMIRPEQLRYLRETYPAGTRVELIQMDDVQAPPAGTCGTVTGIDDTGSLMVRWDIVNSDAAFRALTPAQHAGTWSRSASSVTFRVTATRTSGGQEDEDGEDDLDIDGDGEDDFGVDEPDDTVNVDPKKTMFQELEKEKEVKDAIELIRTRVADAEQAFINRNAADKEKINSLLAKISDNIKTVEKISDNDSDESKVAQESANIAKRRINEITNNRPLTVFECLARNITANIIKNESVKENYITESGQLDTPVVVEAVKVMYGFLETLNTLQLESVDSDYILSIVKEFK